MAIKRHLVHLNGNQLCVVDTETTGRFAGFHEVVQLALMALDANLEPIKSIAPFDIYICPEYPERAEADAIRKIGLERWKLILKQGIPAEKALEIFENWFNRLQLFEEKRISPLAQNWPFDAGHLRALFGNETFEFYFHGHYRDTMAVANYLNDRSDFHAEQLPFAKLGLGSLANRLGIEVDGMLHDALYDCSITAKVYKQMLLEVLV